MPARARLIGFCIAAVLVTSSAAHAQSEPRLRFSVSGGVQSAAATIADQIKFERNFETETIDVKYPKAPGVLIDAGVGVRLWKNLGFGLAVGHATGDGTADVSASIPHPFFFTQPRTVTGKQSGITHSETGVHLQVQYTIPASQHVRIVLGAGPSHLNVDQDVITDVNVAETYPYDTAAFRDAPTKRSTASATGFNTGIDVTWSLTRNFGLGGLARYTRADTHVDVREGHSFSLKAGGAQAAAGVRFAF